MDVGFIGLGTMGRPMVRNLLKAGHRVTIYGRRRTIVEELVSEGAQTKDSPCQVAEVSTVTITMLPDSPDVEQVVTGSDGILDGANAGDIIIDMSTISPFVAQKIAKVAADKGVDFLDAPVSGGESGAIEGTLSIMVGGPEPAFTRCMPIFQALGKHITYMGESGSGQLTKLCNQVICALNIEAVCEGLALGAKSGLNMSKLLHVVSGGAASSWMLSNLAPKMLSRDFDPGFKIDLQQKDLRLALATAERVKLPLPGTGLTHQLFRIAQAAGHGDKGTQALITCLETLGDFKIGGGDD